MKAVTFTLPLWAMTLTQKLREEGYWVEYDVMDRGLKAQMKYSNKLKAKFTMIIGDDELSAGKAKIQNTETRDFTEINLDGDIVDAFSGVMIDYMFASEDIFNNAPSQQ